MSKEFAIQNGLPTYKHHLLPRTKGFLACLPLMKDKVGGLYDIVFAFKGPKGPRTRPSLFDLLRGDRIQAHVYLRRIPFKEVPQEKQAAVKFLYELFDRKVITIITQKRSFFIALNSNLFTIFMVCFRINYRTVFIRLVIFSQVLG